MLQTISEPAGNFQFKKIIIGHLRAPQSRYKHGRECSYLFHILGEAEHNRRLYYKSDNESIDRHFRSSFENWDEYTLQKLQCRLIFIGIKIRNWRCCIIDGVVGLLFSASSSWPMKHVKLLYDLAVFWKPSFRLLAVGCRVSGYLLSGVSVEWYGCWVLVFDDPLQKRPCCIIWSFGKMFLVW
jgi:hypothetical protein